jgi:L-alanine-DL-glutamate epimerase-like enolase superfamily enzyme
VPFVDWRWLILEHSLGELGVAPAAATRVIAATPSFRHDNQAYRALLRDEVVKDFGGPVENYLGGHPDVPSSPGLGIELDLVRVAALRGDVPQPR